MGPLGRAATLWRRSIQARVVISTVLLSALVVVLVGWMVMRQVTEGLARGRADSAVAQAARSAADAQRQLDAVSPDTGRRGQAALLGQLTAGIVGQGAAQGYDVLVGPVSPGEAPVVGGRFTPGLDPASVPERLQQAVGDPTATGTSWTYGRIGYTDGRPSVPGVMVGSQLVVPSDDTAYALYQLFPLTDQQETIGLVRGALLTGGALLLVLVAALSWLVTWQVVTPVRMARRTAERLASGRLEERMHVRGDDDIARLASSFNQMATSLQKQIRQLEEMSRAQRRFVSDVSHELRTPLTTVRMAGDVLHDARDRFDPAVARSAELLQNELDRFEVLLTDLLEISRFDAGAAVLHLEDVNLVDVAHRVVDSTRALAERRRTQVVVRAPARPCVAEVDVRRVERIVRNLVTNAIEYADSTDVVVVVGANDEASALAVRDYGVGLQPGEEIKVFNRFWRADPARARTSGGTGLGLSISLEDARLHGGWLQAWGSPGRGTQFRLTLPRHAGDRLTRSPIPLVPADAAVSRLAVR
jgi:two-component system, OmpR family, sensor histidine kinase MtrB